MAPLSELFGLEGRVAIVTGGSGGLGLEMARALAEAGAQLVVCSRDEERCVEVAAELGSGSIGLRCDVRSEAEVDAVVRATIDEFGRIDILVNNAGTARSAAPEETRLEDWSRVVDVNLTGTFLMAQRVGRELIAAGRGGRIVNLASMAGLVGSPTHIIDAVAYSASKGAVVSFTRDLAVKWAPHAITVNALAPGWFPSDMIRAKLDAAGDELLERIPLGRYGAPDDLRGTIVFLASAASAYITGHTLVVDGGWTAR